MTVQIPEFEDLTDFAVREHRSLWLDAWRRLRSSRTAVIGLVIVTVFILSAVGAHYLWTYEPKMDLDYGSKLLAPNLVSTEKNPVIHVFGTDKLGRDIFRRVIHGGWNSLRVGLVAVSISLIIGGLLGLFAGFFESIEMNFKEKILLMVLFGLAVGTLPAWIANQPIQMFLFSALGAASVFFSNILQRSNLRLVAFGLIGMLLGGIPGLFVAPLVGVVCALLGLIFGLLLCRPMGGKFFSNVTMRAMDIILSFPSYLLAIAIVAFLGPGLEKGMIAIGVVGIPIYARLARSAVMSVSQKEYVLASQSVGEGHNRILFKHILPNILSPIIVQATMGLANAILSAAALGFLGLGAIPPEPEWGAMLGDSYKYLSSGSWWAVLFPGLAIVFSVLGFNLLGDGLRDALDPKMRV
jgi:ABC-type dipeptide/oligopeptide/nickel transport system permease subunit